AGQPLDDPDGEGGLRRDFAGDDGEVGGDERLAGDPAVGVVGEAEVEDGVGDLVGHLVRVAHGHRLAGKQESLAHRRLRVFGAEFLRIQRAWRVEELNSGEFSDETYWQPIVLYRQAREATCQVSGKESTPLTETCEYC